MAVHGIIGKKVGMTQIFAADGTVVPVTVVQAGPCLVVQKKSADKDGYDAFQIGLVGARPDRRANKAAKGRFEKAGVAPMRTLMEVKADKGDDLKPGDKVLCDTFKEKDHVDVIGTSKGKGFMGVVARHGFRGGAATHGSMFHRAPGSIGPSAFPSRVYPGTRSSGRLGGRAGDDQEHRGRARRRREESDLPERPGSGRSKRDRQDRALELREEEGIRQTMAKIAVVNWKKEQVGEVSVPDGVLDYPYRRHLVWEVVKAYQAGQRAGTHSTKVRSEVSGTGKKPFKQKGHRTGAAGRQPPAPFTATAASRTGPSPAPTPRTSPWARRRTR